MPKTVAEMHVILTAKTDKFERNIARADGRLARSANKMERRVQSLDQRLSAIGSGFGLNFASRAGVAAAAVAGVGAALVGVARSGEKLRLIEAGLTAMTGSAERGAAALQGILDTSSLTGTAIDDVAKATRRFTLAADALGATDDEVKRLTESVLKLGRIGGGSQQELSAGAIQLGQALASGRLAGDELRSILENMPLVAKAIADGLGVGVGKLREMGAAGELTSRKVFDAILSKSGEIDAQFQKIPLTVEQATTRMASAFTRVAAVIDQNIGLSTTWASSLNAVADAAESAATELDKSLKSSAALRADFNRRGVEGKISSIDQEIAQQEFSRDRGVIPGSEKLFARHLENLKAERAALFRELFSLSPTPTGGGNRRSPRRRSDGVVDLVTANAPGSSPRPRRAPALLGEPEALTGGGGGATIDPAAVDAAIAKIDQMTESLKQQRDRIGLTGEALARYNATIQASAAVQAVNAEAAKQGITLTDEQKAQVLALEQAYIGLAVSVSRETQEQQDAVRATAEMRSNIEGLITGFSGAIQEANSFEDALRRVAIQLAEVALKGALLGKGPAGGFFNDLLGVAAGGLSAALTGGIGLAPATSPIPAIRPFARGGVVNGPTNFAMAGGLGLMGEAGPEAILPLRRGPGGRLGVESSGGAGGNIIINNNGAVVEARASGTDTIIDVAVSKSVRAVADAISGGGNAVDSALGRNFARKA